MRATLVARPALLLLPLLALFVAVGLAFPDRGDDEAAYLELARNLTNGFYSTGRPDALLDADPASPDLWFGPGLPVVLAPLVAADAPLDVVRLTGPVFLFLAVVVFFHLLRLYVSTGPALAGSAALALYLPFYTLLANLHSEPLAILLIVVFLYAAARLLAGAGTRWLALGAVALAGTAMTRVSYGWVITAMLVAFLAWWAASRSRTPKRLAAMAGLALALCTPWLAYTYSETGRVFLWGNSGSLSLYWMASPYPGEHGDWHQANAVFTDERLAPHRPLFAELEGLDLAEQNARLERAAFELIRDNPLAYLENVAANVSRLLFDAPYSFEAQRLTSLWFALPNALLTGALALAGIAAVRVRRALPDAAAPFLVFAGAALGLHVLLAAYPRMLMPVVPVLVWLVAVVLANHVRLVHAKRTP